MTGRALGALWLVVGVVIWNAFFDLYVSRGAREYRERHAQFELGREPEPSMDRVMRQSVRDGWILSSVWTGVVLTAAAATWRWGRPRP